MRIRCAIHDEHGEAVIYVNTDTATPEVRALVAPILAALTPGELDAVFCLLLRRVADEAGYVRIATQRGVLAL